MPDSMKVLSAAQAYRQAATRQVDSMPFDAAQNVTKPNFSDLVSQTIDDAVTATQRAETIGTKAMMNQASLDDLAVAVSNAELTLKAITAIRDRVITAYQDIIKMPI